jgi:hypothetical protein
MTEVEARAARWEATSRKKDVMFRALDDDRLVELPESAYDDRILAACGSGWTSAAAAAGSVSVTQARASLGPLWPRRDSAGPRLKKSAASSAGTPPTGSA